MLDGADAEERKLQELVGEGESAASACVLLLHDAVAAMSGGANGQQPLVALVRWSKHEQSEVALQAARAAAESIARDGVPLAGCDLSGVRLSGADLTGARLQGCDLRGADLSRCILQRVNLSGAQLEGANLSGARWGLRAEFETPGSVSAFDMHRVDSSPSPTTLLAGGHFGGVFIWNCTTGEMRTAVWPGKVASVSFSPPMADGSVVLVAASKKTVKVYRVDAVAAAGAPGTPCPAPKELFSHALPSDVAAVAFSPHTPTGAPLLAAAAGRADGRAFLWDGRNASFLASLPARGGEAPWGPLNALRFAGGGREAPLVAAYGDGRLRLWSSASRSLVRVVGEHAAGAATALCLLPPPAEGRPPLLASAGDDGCVRFRSLGEDGEAGDAAPPLHAGGKRLRCLAFGARPGVPFLAIGTDESRVKMWDLPEAMAQRRWGGPIGCHECPVRQVAASPDGALVASAGAEGSDRSVALFPAPASSSASPEGRRRPGGTQAFPRTSSRSPPGAPPSPPPAPRASSSSGPAPGRRGRRGRPAAAAGPAAARAGAGGAGGETWGAALAVSSDGLRLAAADTGGGLWLLELAPGPVPPEGPLAARAARVGLHANSLCSAGEDGAVSLWDASEAACAWEPLEIPGPGDPFPDPPVPEDPDESGPGPRPLAVSGSSSQPTCLALSPCGRYAATGSQWSWIHVWDLEADAEEEEEEGDEGVVEEGVEAEEAAEAEAAMALAAELVDRAASWPALSPCPPPLFRPPAEGPGPGLRLATGGSDHGVALWELAEGPAGRLAARAAWECPPRAHAEGASLEGARLDDDMALTVLLQRGAVPYAGLPPELVQIALGRAVNEGDAARVRFLHARCGADLNAKSVTDMSPLSRAAAWGHAHLVRLLSRLGCPVEGGSDFYGYTPLVWAARYGCVEVARALAARGASLAARTGEQETPLLMAAVNGHAQAAEFLASIGADVDACDESGWSPLNCACCWGYTAVVRVLLRMRASVEAACSFQRTPLLSAAFNNKVAVANLLLHHGADPNAAEADGTTPLMYAVQNGSVQMMRLLLRWGARLGAADKGGRTCVDFAAARGDMAILRAILRHPESPPLDRPHPAAAGRTALHGVSELVGACGAVEVARLLVEGEPEAGEEEEAGAEAEEAGTKVEAGGGEDGRVGNEEEEERRRARSARRLGGGADVNARGERDGVTPLMAAIDAGFGPLAEYLVARGADVAAKDSDGWSALIRACFQARGAMAALLVALGADPNDASREGRTALMFAAHGSEEAVRALLDAGARPDDQDREGALSLLATPLLAFSPASCAGWTALSWGAREGQTACVAALLARGACPTLKDSDGWTPLLFACQRGQAGAARALCAHSPELVHVADSKGIRPIMLAAEKGFTSLIALLLEHGADPNAVDKDGWTALYFAARVGSAGATRALLRGGGNPDICSRKGVSPLMVTCDEGAEEVALELLRAGADPALADCDGWTAAFFAARRDAVAVLRRVRDAMGPEALSARAANGLTPLMAAAQTGSLQAARFLVEECGADVNAQTGKGLCPLAIAAVQGRGAMVRLLLERGADANLPNVDGWRPHCFAVQEGNLDVLRALVDAGADLAARTNEGVTPLMIACQKGRTEAARALVERFGAEVDARTSAGLTALMIAAQENLLGMVAMLIERGADPRAARKNGTTVLMQGSVSGSGAIVRALVEAGAELGALDKDGWDAAFYACQPRETAEALEAILDIRAQRGEDAGLGITAKDGRTALMVACQRGNLPAVKLLVGRGADPNAVDHDGWSCLWYAAANDRLEVAAWLLGTEEGGPGVDPNAASPRGTRALHLAAKEGHLRIVDLLIRCGADVDARDTEGVSAVQLAMVMSRVPVVRRLREAGARGANPAGAAVAAAAAWASVRRERAAPSPQQAAARASPPPAPAAPQETSSSSSPPAPSSSSPLHPDLRPGRARPLLRILRPRRAAAGGSRRRRRPAEAPRAAAPQPPPPPPPPREPEPEPERDDQAMLAMVRAAGQGLSTLMMAAGMGEASVVAALLRQGADPNARDSERCTALIHAAREGHIEAVRALCDGGADLDAADDEGFAPLHHAAFRGRLEVARLLVARGANPHARTKTGLTFIWAVQYGHFPVAKYAVECGLNVEEAADGEAGETPLMASVQGGHERIVRWLVDTCKARVNARRVDGTTALMYGAYNGREAICRFLLSRGADPAARRVDGLDALCLAALASWLPTAGVLIDLHLPPARLLPGFAPPEPPPEQRRARQMGAGDPAPPAGARGPGAAARRGPP
eukprot:tig00021179_g19252.t1